MSGAFAGAVAVAAGAEDANVNADANANTNDDVKEVKAAPEPAPLSDEDIAKCRLRSKGVPDAVKEKIFVAVYKDLQGLLKLASQHISAQREVNVRAKSDIEHIGRLLKLIQNDEIFYRLYPKIWAHRQQIMEKNGKFFVDHDYSKLVKEDGKKGMILNIIGIIKHEYNFLTETDRESLWQYMTQILHNVATFLDAVNKSKKT